MPLIGTVSGNAAIAAEEFSYTLALKDSAREAIAPQFICPILALFKGSAVGQAKIRTVNELPLALVVALFPRGSTVGPHSGAPTVPTRLRSAEAIKGGKTLADGEVTDERGGDVVLDVDGLLGDPDGVARLVDKEGRSLLPARPGKALLGLTEGVAEIWSVRPHPVKMVLSRNKQNANTARFVFIKLFPHFVMRE
jgi:hypothetical protein